MTPFLLATILAALVSTAVMIAMWHVDVTAPPASGPSPNRANLIVAVGIAGAAWASVVFALCRDTILRRVDELGEHFSRTAAELAEQAEEAGVFRGMELETRRLRPASRTDGGQVIRHPRLADAPAPDRP